MMRNISCAIVLVIVGLASSCAGRDVHDVDGVTGAPTSTANEPAMVKSARAKFPHVIDMHQKIVSRTCAPNAGVCHNTSNYPDLSTTGALLETVDSWCNLDMPDPTQGFDLCERKGNVAVVTNQFESEIAYFTRDAVDHWTFTFRDAAPNDVVAQDVFFYESVPDQPAFLPVADWQVVLDIAKGSKTGTVSVNNVADNPFVEQYVDEVLGSLVPGDPNQNGVFGADQATADDDGARVIAKGSLARSYLWGRITGTVPGTRMPLANQPIADDEYVAIACFIETLGDDATPDSAIDYDHCDFAQHPQSLAVGN